MTGWRLGWLTHPADLAPTIAKLVQITTSGVPQFLQRAAVTAIEDGDHVIRDLRARCQAGRDRVFDRLESWPRLRLAPPKDRKSGGAGKSGSVRVDHGCLRSSNKQQNQ